MGIREKLLNKLDEEIRPLERELKVELPRQLSEAAAHGDLSENAEYDAAKQRKELVQAKLARLQRRRASLSRMDTRRVSRDAIGFWSKVKLLDLDSDEEVTYSLVSPDESDPAEGMISISSPIGRALAGHRVGDDVFVETPRGTRTYEVVEFTTIHERDDIV